MLAAQAGLPLSTMKEARDELLENGLITWEPGERNRVPAQYGIGAWLDTGHESGHEPDHESGYESGHEPGYESGPLYKERDRGKEIEKPPSTPPVSDETGGAHKKKKQPKEWQPDETQQRINRLFRRKDSTRWKADELAAYRQNEYTEEDLAEIERYYSADIPGDDDYRRRDILRLLRHWPGEVDRARCWKPKPKYKPGHMLDIPDDYGPPGVSYGL